MWWMSTKDDAWKAGIEEKDKLSSEVVERAVWEGIVDNVRVKFVP